MKRIKNLNGYAIYQAGARDVTKYGFEDGSFYVYFASDVKDFGLTNSTPEYEGCGSLEEAEANCAGNFARAKEIVEERTTAASMEEILEVEAQLDAGMDPDEIAELAEQETVADVIASKFPSVPQPDVLALAGKLEQIRPGLTPEQAAELIEAAERIFNTVRAAFDEVVAAVMRIGKALAEIAAPVMKQAAKGLDQFHDALLYATAEDPKHWHYYKHAKKARTRKKYRHRLEKSLAKALAAGSGGPS
ncbi:MAG: hypothetical protein WHF31_12250 [Candidatus Dehalobacter alkaniphilus]